MPAGSVPAHSQASWLCAALGAIEDAELRTDAETALRALVWLLARWADWRTPLLSRPTWAVLMAGTCLLYTSPSPRDRTRSRMPSSA